jgi:hypothetical protein
LAAARLVDFLLTVMDLKLNATSLSHILMITNRGAPLSG